MTRQIALNSPILNFTKIRLAVLQSALGPKQSPTQWTPTEEEGAPSEGKAAAA